MAIPIDIFRPFHRLAKMDQLVSFEPAPTRRGTIDIIYSCISTLVICVWTTIHMNVSPEGETTWQHLRKKAGWTLFTIIFPEFMLFRAIILFIQANEAMRSMNKYYKNNSQVEGHTLDGLWTLTDGFFSRMKGFTYGDEVVDGLRIVELMRREEVPPVPSYAREIRDRSKADGFAKSVACVQALWLVIQCIARKAEGLPMSLLELGTMAYVTLSIFIYGFLWFAPKDVTTKIPISPQSSSSLHSPDSSSAASNTDQSPTHTWQEGFITEGHEQQQATEGGMTWMGPVTQRMSALADKLARNHATPPNRSRRLLKFIVDVMVLCLRLSSKGYTKLYNDIDLPADFRVHDRDLQIQSWMLLPWGGFAWGTLHCLGWNFSFPSPVEKWLWRICSILSTIGPWGYMKQLIQAAQAERRDWGFDGWFGAFVAVIALMVRLTLLVEMFISLRHMPSDVYESVQWTSLIPHF